MKKTRHHIFFVLTLMLLVSTSASAQVKEIFKHGMYFQWGWNREAYTRSNIHFKIANGDNFTLYKLKAHDKPDFDNIYKKPTEISIPQYNYRIGFYLDKEKNKSLEINFDHIKYVVTDYQTARISGTIAGKQVQGDTILDPKTFLHLEHTDGGNLLHINYASQKVLVSTKSKSRPLIKSIWKLGAGINIPRTDFSYQGNSHNNDFHVAGFNFGAEAGFRFFMLKKLFLETTGKTGYVRYVNALANTQILKGNRVRHGFAYIEGIATIGYNISF